MFKRGIFAIITFALLCILHPLLCDVTLRVILHPPIATLECLITNPVEKTSAIMMCPQDKMCFQSCSPICDTDCGKNVITCTETKSSNALKYTYTFDTTNALNQGDWSCHFGAQKSSTVLFVNETKPVTSTVRSVEKTTSRLSSAHSTAKLLLPSHFPILKPIYVIIILASFALSLCLNIYCVIRSMLRCFRSHSKTPAKFGESKKKSCIAKVFCSERVFQTKIHRGYRRSLDNNRALSTQVSSNVYESNKPDLLLDNNVYINPAANHRLLTQAMFTRSQSFPSKNIDRDYQSIVDPVRSIANSTVPRSPLQVIPRPDSASQTIYDDVPDFVPSIAYAPYTNYYIKLPYNRGRSMAPLSTVNRLNAHVAMSLNNLTNADFQIPEHANQSDENAEEAYLKEVINSRVELSKEMISHADTLLKRAGSLLSDSEQMSDNSK